jgi:formylglycine-generating enzyme required for sulfatase activity
MTGNVWEWTSSLWQSYPYDPHDGRENPASLGGRRIVRGGSWYDAWGLARAACRFHDRPEGRYDYLGFRLACSSPIIRTPEH